METLSYRFCEIIPEALEENILYISMERGLAIHLCICGCKNEVVTPFSPTDWKLIFNGISVSLKPSIGNWNFKCKSHYFITENKIEYARSWSDREIADGRRWDKNNKNKFYKKGKDEIQETPNEVHNLKSKFSKLKKFFSFLS